MISSPVPPQRGHGVAVTIWPRIDWRTRRTSPAPWQTVQVIGRGAGPGAGAQAGLAGLGQAHGQVALHPEDRLGELQGHGRLGVLALPGSAPGPGPAGHATHPAATAAEEGVEQVAEPATEPGERVPGSARARPRHAPEPFRPEHVVLAPAFRVPERLVGQVDHLELLLGPAVAGVGVGMELARQAQVGALDLVLAGLARDPEQLVEIVDVGHSQLTLPVPVPSLSA